MFTEMMASGSGSSKELLWTNSNPSADFGSQFITLPNPYTNYKYICIEWAYNRDTLTVKQNILVDGLPTAIGSSGYDESAMVAVTSSGAVYIRRFHTNINDNTKIAILSGQLLSSAASVNSVCIPLAIYGIN